MMSERSCAKPLPYSIMPGLVKGGGLMIAPVPEPESWDAYKLSLASAGTALQSPNLCDTKFIDASETSSVFPDRRISQAVYILCLKVETSIFGVTVPKPVISKEYLLRLYFTSDPLHNGSFMLLGQATC